MASSADDYVLVVDDDLDIRETLTAALDAHGYRAEGVGDGAEALAWLHTHASPPCLIVLDLMMPNVDGVAFRHAQLGEPALASIPVMVLTGAASFDRRGALAGLEVIRKPIDLETLLAKVKRYCAVSAG